MALQLLLVTPERRVIEAQAEEVQLPGSQGYLGILPGHTPLVTLLKTGVLSYRGGGRSEAFAVSAGLAEIAGDRVSILADSAESAAEIDAASAERDLAKAEEELKSAGIDTLDGILRRAELARARLAVVRRPS